MNIYKNLQTYCESGIYPMHMPGHKRNPLFQMGNPYRIDVTEVEGTDNLHRPEGMILDLMDQMKQIYQTEKSWLLVNGSTCGILSAISACARRGDTVIMDRNCHRSVYHAIYLLELRPVYLYPDIEEQTGIALGIRGEQVAAALQEHPEASCVIITSPTYEGVVSEIRDIADKVHERHLPLIVDEAHGAHFAWGHSFWKEIPETAMLQGADLVIESLHKTLPALTQTAVLHICSQRVSPEVVERYLEIYQTSSPSYVLMSSVSQCMEWMAKNSERMFAEYQDRWLEFCQQAAGWKILSLWEHPQKEPTKLVIMSGTLTGYELAVELRERYHIQVEMETSGYILAMTSVCDTEDGWRRLAGALQKIDKELAADIGRQEEGKAGDACHESSDGQEIVRRMSGRRPVNIRKGLYEAMNCPYQEIPLKDSVGKISAEYVFIYPPGIPFLVPGEEIREELPELVRTAKERNLNLMGLKDETGACIRVCAAVRKGEGIHG